MENLNQQIDNLRIEKRKLIESIRLDRSDKKLIEKINSIDFEIKKLEAINLVNEVNGKQNRLRKLAAELWGCEIPTSDISNSDGSFHAVKVKKYPKLAALKYAYVREFKDNKIIEINVNGERFRMHKCKYHSNNPNEYTRPDTFEQFLELNSIALKDFTIEEYIELSEKINAINKQFEGAVKLFEEQKDALKLHDFSHFGLLNYTNAGHIYKYEPKK